MLAKDSFILKKYNNKLKNQLSHTFNSGNLYLDNFIKSNEALNPLNGKTYVFLDTNQSNLIAYFNIGTGSIGSTYSKPKDKIGGSVHLNCFALDLQYQGLKLNKKLNIKLSDILLNKCVKKILSIQKNHIGFAFITLCSTKQGYNLYKRHGFENIDTDMIIPIEIGIEDGCQPMYLPLNYTNII